MTQPSMPTSSLERRGALSIMEWAYESQGAQEADPDGVLAYRQFFDTTVFGKSDVLWRQGYDMALAIWKRAYATFQGEQAKAMELF